MTTSELAKLETNTQTIERLTRERNDALRKCAEMRECLETMRKTRHGFLNAEVVHALSGECGSGYVNARELDEGIRLLRDASTWTTAIAPRASRWFSDSADRLARLKEMGMSDTKPLHSNTWPYVLSFAEIMETKLSENRHKGDRNGWINDSAESLLDRLRDETHELEIVIEQGHVRLAEPENRGRWSERISREAADVANFAMMIADVCGGLECENEKL